MSDLGFFAVDRAIWDHAILAGEPFTKREAWMWLVSEAAWKARTIRAEGRMISLQRGELVHAVRFIADKWQWSKSRVARFLDTLKKRDMLRDNSRDNVTVYAITNYDEYQLGGRDTPQPEHRDKVGTRAGHERDKEEELNNSTIENIPSLRSGIPADEPKPVQAILVLEAQADDIPDCLDRTPERKAMRDYNLVADSVGWPKAQLMSDKRRRELKARLRECGGVDGWREAMARARASPFLSGTGPRGKGYENWTPDLDYFLQPSTFTKLMEGKYDERLNAGSNNGFSSPVFTGAANAIARRRRAREAGEGVESQADYGTGAPIAAGGTG